MLRISINWWSVHRSVGAESINGFNLDEIGTLHDVEEIVQIHSTAVPSAGSVGERDHLADVLVRYGLRLWPERLRLRWGLVPVLLLLLELLLFLRLLPILDFFFVEGVCNLPQVLVFDPAIVIVVVYPEHLD